MTPEDECMTCPCGPCALRRQFLASLTLEDAARIAECGPDLGALSQRFQDKLRALTDDPEAITEFARACPCGPCREAVDTLNHGMSTETATRLSMACASYGLAAKIMTPDEFTAAIAEVSGRPTQSGRN